MDKDVDELQFIINLLESLRNHFKLTMTEIDKNAGLKERQYSRMIDYSQKFDLESLRDICNKIYNLSIKKLLNLDGSFPKEEDLPDSIRKLIEGRLNVRKQDKLDLPAYVALIIDRYYKVEDLINNAVIRTYLPESLRSKAIELGKTSFKDSVKDVNEGKKSTRKIYKLASKINAELIDNYKTIVDGKWLEEFESKFKHKNIRN